MICTNILTSEYFSESPNSQNFLQNSLRWSTVNYKSDRHSPLYPKYLGFSPISFRRPNNQFLAGHSSCHLLHLHNGRSNVPSNSYGSRPLTAHTARWNVSKEEPERSKRASKHQRLAASPSDTIPTFTSNFVQPLSSISLLHIHTCVYTV